jgi:protein phosphatase inhibitor 2
MANTLQNAGHRRSSSAARRQSASRRHSSIAGASEDDPNKSRLQWDEAQLYLQEQEKGGRMKITEPKTPYQYGDGGAMDEDEEDVAIDPRYVNVDEVDMAKSKSQRKARESEIPGLDIGEPEDEGAQEGAGLDSARIVRSGSGSLSREGSKEKHASVSGDFQEHVGMPTRDELEKHKQFEEQRKKHYEMRDVKGLLG